MVSSALQEAVGALTLPEKVELRDFIDMSLGSKSVLTEHQRATITRRAAELDDDPSLGIPWDEVNAELKAEFG